MPEFLSPKLLGIFAVDDIDPLATTELYIYVQGISEAEMAQILGYRNKTGAIVDGFFTDWCQAATGTATPASIDDLTETAVEVDADTDSPYAGYLRLVFTVTPGTDT